MTEYLNPQNLPKVIALDFETALTTGEASLDFYREDFRVKSCAFSWKIGNTLEHAYLVGEDDIARMLSDIANLKISVVVHNLSFEYAVCAYRFKFLVDHLNWSFDTMRMAQVADNGLAEVEEMGEYAVETTEEQKKAAGLSLVNCVRRWLPTPYHNHKNRFYEVLRTEFGVKRGQEGANLNLLTPELLQEYNVMDTTVTLLLYYALDAYFTNIQYDFRFDHGLYLSMVKLIAKGKGKGVQVDQELARSNLKSLQDTLAATQLLFQTKFFREIKQIEEENKEKLLNLRKTEKGKLRMEAEFVNNPEIYQFKVNSSAHKSRLFIDILGIKPTYFTEKGAPSFSKSFLHQWGEGGLILLKYGTISLTKVQLENLIEISDYDTRWHIDLRVAGTSTGRLVGKGGE